MKKSCPLGHKCQTFNETGLIDQCEWYVTLAGQHPQTAEMIDEKACAIAWMPILLVENANTNRGQTAAIESFRNNVVNLIEYAKARKQIERS